MKVEEQIVGNCFFFTSMSSEFVMWKVFFLCGISKGKLAICGSVEFLTVIFKELNCHLGLIRKWLKVYNIPYIVKSTPKVNFKKNNKNSVLSFQQSYNCARSL